MATRGSQELAVRSAKFDQYKQKIAQKKLGLEGQLKASVASDGPLAEFGSIAASGFTKYPCLFAANLLWVVRERKDLKGHHVCGERATPDGSRTGTGAHSSLRNASHWNACQNLGKRGDIFL